MKKQLTLTILFLSFFAVSFAQDANQISTMRFGPFKLGSKIVEVEGILKSKVQVKKRGDNWADTINAKYNGADYRLVFTNETDEKNQTTWKLYSISSKNTSLKTKSGIGIGSTKPQILLAYDKFNLTVTNDWEYKEKNNVKDKIQFIQLADYEAETMIYFTTVDRNVTEIEVSYNIGD